MTGCLSRSRAPLGVLLAGGAGVRLGGSKLTVALGGRPLFSYPLAALSAALARVVVIGKPGLTLPGLGSAEVWSEPALPRHPLVGIVHALMLADGAPVLVCPADLPFVTPELIALLARSELTGAPVVIAGLDGAWQPLLGRYERAAAQALAAAAAAHLPVHAAVSALHPPVLEVADAEPLFNVNTPEDLARAAAILARRLA